MSSTSARAICAACGKTYAVPDPSRSYTCKACGGSVAVADRSPAAQTREPASDGAARRQAAAELQQALNVVVWLRRLFAAGAIVYGLISVFLLVLLPKGIVEEGALLVTLAVTTVMACLHVVGFRQARMQPFLWTLLLAVLATLSVALHLMREGGVSLQLMLRLLSAAALWSAVWPTARVRALVAAHPDLYSAHRLHGTDRRRHGASTDADHSQQRFAKARRATALGSLAWASGMALVVLSVALLVRPSNAAAGLEPRLDAFRSAWAAGDATRVAALAPASDASARGALLESQVAAHGWGTDWPALDEPRVQLGTTQATAAWELEAGVLHTTWEREDDEWWLVKLRLPIPPLDGAVERLVTAWIARDVAALAALYPPDKRESAASSIARVIERRAWGDDWPDLLDASARPSGETGANVTFRVADDELVTRWDFREEHGWCLTSLNLPD